MEDSKWNYKVLKNDRYTNRIYIKIEMKWKIFSH